MATIDTEPKLTFVSCPHRHGWDDMAGNDLNITLDDDHGVVLQLCPTCAEVVRARVLSNIFFKLAQNEAGRLRRIAKIHVKSG